MFLSFNNNYDKKYDIYLPLLTKLTKKSFKLLNITNNYIIEVNFIDDKRIKELNTTYRHLNKATDVLSFAFLELKDNEVKIKSKQPQFLGEIDISIDRVKKQAKDLHHSIPYELCYLYIHGLLHLCGYDHVHDKIEALKMFSKEEEILLGEKI